jgi:TP901 family phage tail tape measure protein
MAVTAREVIMVFRGQNYLSSAIRRVGRDVGMLSRTQQLSAQRAQLQITGQRLRQSRAVAASELASVRTGTRKLALDQARAGLTQREIQDHVKLNNIYDQQNANLANRLRLQNRSEMVAAAQGGTRRGFTKNLNTEQLARESRAIQLAQASNIAGMDTLEMRRQAAISAIGNQSIASQQLLARETELAAREAQLTQIINTRSKAIDLNTAKLEENALAMKRLPWERFQAGAQMVEHAGRALSMFGLIGTAVFGALAKYAADFNTQVTLAATQAIEPSKNSVQQIQRISTALSAGILKILQSGTAVGSSAEFNKSAYDILSGITALSSKSAVKIKQTLGLLKEFNLVTKANFGLVTFNQVTQAGITLMNTFGTSFKQLPREFDVMQKAVNRGRLTMGQFTDGLNQTAAPARAAGFTFDQMAGTLSFLSTKFPSYNRAAVGYARLVEVLAKPTFISNLKAAGVSITDITGKHLLPFDQVMERLVKRFPQLTKGGLFVQNFFKQFSGQTGFIGARRAFTVAAQDPMGLEKFTKEIPKARGLVNASATALSQTGGVKWAMLVTQLKTIAIVIGRDVIPVFVQLAKPLEAAAKWFNNLSPSAQKTIATVGAVTSVVALLGGTLIMLIGGLASFAIGMKFFVGGLIEARTAMAGAEAGAIGLRLALGLGLAAAIFLLIKYHRQVMDIINALGGLKNVAIAVGVGFAAWKITTLITGLEIVGTTAVATAGEVGILEASMLALGGPEVLAALAAAAAALAFLYGFKGADPRKNISGKDNVNTRVLINDKGQLFRQDVTGLRGPGVRQNRGPITDAQAKGLGVDKAQLNAIRTTNQNKIIEAQRFSNVSNMIVKENKALATNNRLKATNISLDASAGVTAHTGQRSVQQWIAVVERAHKATLGNPHDVAKARAYEQILLDLNKRFKDQPALLSAINDVLGSYDQNLKNATDSAKTLGVTFQDVLSGVQGMYNNFLQQEQGIFGTLFSGPFVNAPTTQNRLQWGGILTGKDLLKDLQSQVSQFRNFHSILNNLAKRGAPAELIKQLTALGPDSIKQIRALGQLSKPELQKYFGIFKSSQKLVHDQTMRDLNNQLTQYRKYGRNIALAIVAGLRDENVALTKSLTNMVHKMFPGLPVGQTGAGGKPTHKPQPDKTGPTVTHEHAHVHITTTKGNEADARRQARHAAFIIQQKFHHR